MLSLDGCQIKLGLLYFSLNKAMLTLPVLENCNYLLKLKLPSLLAEFLEWQTGTTLTLSSPHFPTHYLNNDFRIWNIRVPPKFHLVSVSVNTFNTQTDSDHVYIGNGEKDFHVLSDEWTQLSGSLQDIWNKTSFQVIYSIVTVIFTSDGQGTASAGFCIQFTGHPDEPITSSSEKSYSQICKCIECVRIVVIRTDFYNCPQGP